MSVTSKAGAAAATPGGLGTAAQQQEQQQQPPASQAVPQAAAPPSHNSGGRALSTTPPAPLVTQGPGTGMGGTGTGMSMAGMDREGSMALPGEEKDPGEEMKKRIVEYSPQKRYVKFNEVLGKGAYKMVYRAYDTKEGLLVAWNTISLAGLPKQEKIRIMHEVRLLEQLDHGNIISFFGSWINREREEVVFITEILSSGSLKDFIKKVQVIRWKIIKRWCRQILRGLSYLHSHVPPIIHRDLKCDNIFINGSSGDLRIGDLGLSTYITGRTAPLSVLGTPEFMAPELYDEKYDEKVDVYAFGMCVLEMVTKETPYSECANAAQIYKKVISQVPPQVIFRVRNERARDFIRSCLASDPTHRPTVEELLVSAFLKQSEDDDEEVIVDPPFASASSSLDGSGASTASQNAHRPSLGGSAQGGGGGGGYGGSSHLHHHQHQHHQLGQASPLGLGPSKSSASLSTSPGQQRPTHAALEGATRDGPGATLRRVSQDAKPVASQLPAERKGGASGGAVVSVKPGSEYAGSSSGSSDGDPAELRHDLHGHHHHQHPQQPQQPQGAHGHGHGAHTPHHHYGQGGVERTLSSHSLATSATSEGSSHHPYELPTPALSHSGSEGTLESVNTSSPVLEGVYGEGVPGLDGHHHHAHGHHHGLHGHGTHSHSSSALLRDREGKPIVRASSFYQPGSGPGGERPPRHAPSPMSHSSAPSLQHRQHHHHHHLEYNDSWALLHVKGATPGSASASASTSGHHPPPHLHLKQPLGGATPTHGSAPSTPTAGPTVQLRAGEPGAGPGRRDVLCLVIRAKIKGKLRDIEFDFHLSEDDATQVAQEMVSELGLPASDLGSVASTIHRLAEESRRQRDLERGVAAGAGPHPHEIHRTTSLEGAAFVRRVSGGAPPPSALNSGAGGRPRVPMPRSLSTNNMGQLARHHHPGMGMEPSPLDPHARTHSGAMGAPQHGRQRSDASDSGGVGVGGGGGWGPDGSQHGPAYHHHLHHLSDDDLSRASPAASLAGDHYAGCLSSDDESGSGSGAGGLGLDGAGGGAAADGDDEELSKLRTDYEKNVQRSQKAFSIRLENLKKSKQEKEESHRKQLEKHLKDMAEFERKVRTAEREQIERLKELEEQWRGAKSQHREHRRQARQTAAAAVGDGGGAGDGGSTNVGTGRGGGASPFDLSSSSAAGEQQQQQQQQQQQHH